MAPGTASILVVDDNAANRALAKATLEEEGYEVVLAADGGEALRSFELRPPDCVLLDVKMPGMDGFAVCQRMRALPGGAHTPIVFLTAQRDLDTFDAAQTAGADDFLTKPVRPTELALRVHAALKLRSLGERNRELVDTIRRQRDDLMRLQLLKEQLVAFLVHDLKNPVNAIDLQTQVVLRDAALSDRARTAALRTRDSARTLNRMILDLLDIAKSEEGRLEPKRAPVALAAVVDEVFDALQVRAQTHVVKLEAAIGDVSLEADPDLLRRVLENLVDNALRHAPEDTSIRVTAERAAAEDVIRIADHGPGVPPELRESVFDRFVRIDRMEGASQTSRGLGLAFCKVAVEAHGGSIAVEDGTPGAVFVVRLPRA